MVLLFICPVFGSPLYSQEISFIETTHSNLVCGFWQLSSAVSPDVMPFTNYTFDFRGMIDYVFYDTKSLQPLGVLGPISDEWMEENKVVGCPHPHLHSGTFSTKKN